MSKQKTKDTTQKRTQNKAITKASKSLESATKKKPGPKPKLDQKEDLEQQLSALGKIQATVEEVASVLGVCKRTLMSHFSANEDHRELYEMGKEEGRASLRRYQFDMAKKNPTMSIWLGKQYLGQQDKQAHEHSGGIVNEIALKIVDPKR